jgi:tyrosyl-tRNA synthetase
VQSVYEELTSRGFVAQTSHEDLGDMLAKEQATMYVGFDPTARSLHLGNLLCIMAMAHFQRHGHRVIALVGGATGMVGDPSGKSEERNLLTPDQVAENAAALRDQLSIFLDFSGPNAAMMVDNNTWIGPMSFIDWLRDVGKHFTVNYMLAKDSVKSRLGSDHGISFTEFSYMTMQAYDYLHLYDTYGCKLQCGGSDQWGNITAGIELIRRVRGERAFGLTFPLLTTATGEKFGKSAGNAIWLDAERSSPYQLYQYLMQSEDADVEKLLKIYTFLPLDQVEAIAGEHAEHPERRQGQRALAEELTRMLHGEEGLAKAQAASQALFGGDLRQLDESDLLDIFADVPSTKMDRARLEEGLDAVTLMAEAGLYKSKGEARRAVKQGGAYLNNERVADADRPVTAGDLLPGSVLVLRSGKKNYHLVRVV